MDTKIALAVVGVVGAALLATVVYALADSARWVYQRGAWAVRTFATFVVATYQLPTRASGLIGIKLGRH